MRDACLKQNKQKFQLAFKTQPQRDLCLLPVSLIGITLTQQPAEERTVCLMETLLAIPTPESKPTTLPFFTQSGSINVCGQTLLRVYEACCHALSATTLFLQQVAGKKLLEAADCHPGTTKES